MKRFSWMDVSSCEVPNTLHSICIWDIVFLEDCVSPTFYNSTYSFCYCYAIKTAPKINISPLRPMLKLLILLISNESSGAKRGSRMKKNTNNEQKYSFYFLPDNFRNTERAFFFLALSTRILFLMYVVPIITTLLAQRRN